jgi:hypothetical protein
MVAGAGGSVQTVLSQTVYRNFLILVPTLGIGVGNRICLHYTRTLKSCNTDLKLTQSILLHIAPQPVKLGGSRWWERSAVFHNLCQRVFCAKIINFFSTRTLNFGFRTRSAHRFIFALEPEMSELSLHSWNMVIKQQFNQTDIVLFPQACGHL